MSTVKKADQETLKNINRQIILNHIRLHREISRIDLAKFTKLSPTTVSAIVSELLAKKLVNETRIGESSGGRKPLMLGINANARCVLIVVLSPRGAGFSTVNMDFQIVHHEYIARSIRGEEAVVEILNKGLEMFSEKYPGAMDGVCGIGISVPGVVEHEKGVVLYSSKLHLSDFDISSVVDRYCGIKTYIFKDTDALLLGEYNFGAGNAYGNVAYINIEDGVGMSYVNSGRLFKPGYGGGFELGHITIDSGGSLCRCGNRGCLGTVVSEAPALVKLKTLIEKGYESGIEVTKNTSLADIVEYSNNGDKAARYVLEEQARLLGTAVASVINLFNPQLIAIGGPLSKCTWGFLDILRDTVKDRALPIYSKNVEIRFARLGEDSALVGMANEILENEIFKPVDLKPVL